MRNGTQLEGKVLLFFGGFQRILPVIEGCPRVQIVHTCFKTSWVYRNLQTLQLIKNMRMAGCCNDPNAVIQLLTCPNVLLAYGKGCVQRSKQERAIFHSSDFSNLMSTASVEQYFRALTETSWFMIDLHDAPIGRLRVLSEKKSARILELT